jgi:hypothetical protein
MTWQRRKMERGFPRAGGLGGGVESGSTFLLTIPRGVEILMGN